MSLSKQAKEEIREEFYSKIADFSDDNHHNVEPYSMQKIADFFLRRFEEEGEEKIEQIINDLESNPNEDGSESPNIMHWIEQKQAQLRRKYLSIFNE